MRNRNSVSFNLIHDVFLQIPAYFEHIMICIEKSIEVKQLNIYRMLRYTMINHLNVTVVRLCCQMTTLCRAINTWNKFWCFSRQYWIYSKEDLKVYPITLPKYTKKRVDYFTFWFLHWFSHWGHFKRWIKWCVATHFSCHFQKREKLLLNFPKWIYLNISVFTEHNPFTNSKN